ncbi:MAG: hypothetical protein Q9192_003442 [Flavoplaca navasiana]
MAFYLSLIVPNKEVKTIKTTLEAHGLFDKRVRISPVAPAASAERSNNVVVITPPCQSSNSLWGKKRNGEPTALLSKYSSHHCSHEITAWFSIPTVFGVDESDGEIDPAEATEARETVLGRIGIIDRSCIGASVDNHTPVDVEEQSPLKSAIHEWLERLRLEGIEESEFSDISWNKCKWTYTVYPPMLLIPPSFFSEDLSQQLIAGPLNHKLPELWRLISRKFKVTHIAINKPIPLEVANASAASKGHVHEPNTLRSPANLTPVHGDFGEADLPATEENFQRAFWVSTVQNDIVQVWPPLYTMFSRGNIREKTRLLKLLSPASQTQSHSSKSSGSSAVDLYAGIGYFAFSYAKAGLNKVLCWELNRWSVEGLRRGAKKNGWATKMVLEHGKRSDTPSNDYHSDIGSGSERLLIFNESNHNAAERIGRLRSMIPPIRHVNCGYLPSSTSSWDVAVRVLDPLQGGWIHAHENVGLQDIDQRKCEVVEMFKGLVCQAHEADSGAYRFHVECEHVERVKTYAPGVMHVVFDISLLPDKLPLS